MHRHLNSIALASAFAILFAVPAAAGTIYVSPGGTNTATCGTTPATACKTLQQANARVDAGGTVLLTQPGDYGAAIISKPMSIISVPGGGIFSPATPCLTVNMAGANDTLNVSGLTCNMDGAAKDGIVFNNGHKLRLENTVIRGNTGGSCGVNMKPTDGITELIVDRGSFTENGTQTSGNGGGICAKPTWTTGAQVQVNGVIRNTMLQNGRHGLFAGAQGTGAAVNLVLDNVDASQNAGGIFALGPNSTVCIRNSTISGNSVFGLGGMGSIKDGGGNLVFNNVNGNTFPSGTCP